MRFFSRDNATRGRDASASTSTPRNHSPGTASSVGETVVDAPLATQAEKAVREQSGGGDRTLEQSVTFGVREKKEPYKSKRDPYLVGFDYLDPEDPRGYPLWKKWLIVGVCLVIEAWANNISSMLAPGVSAMSDDLGVSLVKGRVVQAIFLYGFAVGSVIITPISEDYGRKPVQSLSIFLLAIFQIPCALAPNYAVMLVFRFLSGFFASTTFTSVGVINDCFNESEQGWPVNSFALAAEFGAVFGPIVGGYLFEGAGWRWVFGVLGIVTIALLPIYMFVVPETRAGIILIKRARRKRKETGEPYYAQHEKDREGHTVRARIQETIVRPVTMLLTEPIVYSLAIFDGLNYAIIYLWLGAFPLIFETYGFTIGESGLPFLAVGLGFLIAYVCYPLQMAFERRSASKADGDMAPEARLAWSLIGGVLFPMSLFWFAWTAQPSVHWIVCCVAATLFGISSHIIFIAVSDYTISSYGPYAASAVGAQSLLREVLSGSVTLFGDPMYINLGYPWAGSVLAFIATALALVPPVLFFYGHHIRKRSNFAEAIRLAEEQAAKDAKHVKEVWTRSQTQTLTNATEAP